MALGSRCGADGEGARVLSVGAFVKNDGGYTSVAVALALLVSLALVFSAATVEWSMARSSEVQEVADAAAMAGANCVAAFSTVVQVIDACVLSLGLAGVLVFGAGMVVSSIPFVQTKAPQVLAAGRQLLDARRSFARSAASGLRHLEQALPALIMANSASCVSANGKAGMEYLGCAVPFPQASETDYSFLDEGPDPKTMEDSAQELREATQKKEEALRRANAAKERAWRADCVDAPLCMRSRAKTLSGMSGAKNPNYASPEAWSFEYARLRAVNYYRLRSRQEAPASSQPEELTRSAARKVFYEYASEAVAAGVCKEDDPVSLDLPELPHTKDMVRASSLYTDVFWPCTQEEAGRTLHSTLSCPAAAGPASGSASLAQLEAGAVRRCDTCGMDVSAMGSVADASTNINNGFEHYWRIVVRASKEYQEARRQAFEADRRMRELAEKNASLFQQAMDALSVTRPHVKPAGAWGCVALVVRRGSVSTPSELTSAFVSGATLPPGAAMSAATLAPDDATAENNVLSRAFDGLTQKWGRPIELVGSVAELWGKLLVGYGSAYGSVSKTTDDLLEDIGSLFGERVAAWIRSKISAIVDACALEPADMRLRKPVLVRTQRVLDQANLTSLGEARRLVESFPTTTDELLALCKEKIQGELGSGDFTVATLPIPGMGELSIPLTLDVSKLAGAS